MVHLKLMWGQWVSQKGKVAEESRMIDCLLWMKEAVMTMIKYLKKIKKRCLTVRPRDYISKKPTFLQTNALHHIPKGIYTNHCTFFISHIFIHIYLLKK